MSFLGSSDSRAMDSRFKRVVYSLVNDSVARQEILALHNPPTETVSNISGIKLGDSVALFAERTAGISEYENRGRAKAVYEHLQTLVKAVEVERKGLVLNRDLDSGFDSAFSHAKMCHLTNEPLERPMIICDLADFVIDVREMVAALPRSRFDLDSKIVESDSIYRDARQAERFLSDLEKLRRYVQDHLPSQSKLLLEKS